MAYEDSAVQAREGADQAAASPVASPDPLYQGDGLDRGPGSRGGPSTGSLPVISAQSPEPSGEDGESTLTLGTLGRRVPPTPNLDYVFDDPDEGEPGPDRMLVHGLWELLMALAVAGVGFLLYRWDSGVLRGDGLTTTLLSMTVLGGLAVGSALALRAGVPNLAIGPVAVASGLYFAQHPHGGLAVPLGVVIGLCAALGLAQGLATVVLHVPAWAVSLGVSVSLLAWINSQEVTNLVGGYAPDQHTYYWFGGFCGLSALGGLIGLTPGIRRGFGRFRPVADPATRRGVLAGLVATGAVVGSTVLGGVVGVLAATNAGSAGSDDGLVLTTLGLGAALLGGTSAYGRRGGIFGTIFAAGLLTVVASYAEVRGWRWPDLVLGAAAIGIGLVVTRLVERYGRPPQLDDDDLNESDESWTPIRVPAAAPSWSPKERSWQTGSGSNPAVTVSTSGLWDTDESWSGGERR